MHFKSKLPNTKISIFTQMTQMAQKYDAINLSQGFPDFSVDTKLLDLVSQKMRDGFNQYAPMPGTKELRDVIAQKYFYNNNLTIDPDTQITITAGGTQALYTAIGALIHHGDEVIIFEPAYDSYRPSVESFGGVVRAVNLLLPDFSIDWDYVESLITDKTKLIIINTPNNPTGRVFTHQDILQLEKLVSLYNLYVLSDEVYEHIVYDDHKHLSILSSELLRQRSFVVASFGKLLHTTGWKMGYVVANASLTAEFRKIHQFNVFSVNTPIQYAIAEYLSDVSYYANLSSFFQEKRNFLQKALEDTGFNVLKSEGTYFMLLDYSNISNKSEFEFASYLTEYYKVAMIPVSAFYSDSINQNLLRICFAKNENTLENAVYNLKKL